MDQLREGRADPAQVDDELQETFDLPAALVSPAPVGRTRRSWLRSYRRPARAAGTPRGDERARPGRHAPPSVHRQAWEGHYIRLLLLSDLLAGTVAGALAFWGRFNHGITAYNRFYLLGSLLLAATFPICVAINRGYDRRYLFIGTDEYVRVVRAGMTLTCLTAMISYASEIRLARGYVLIAVPALTLACMLLRLSLRKWLHGLRARGRCMRRVIVVGHELAVVAITHQLRRERYHGLEVVGCCLPPGHDGRVGVSVYGTFDDVADAVAAARADTVVALSCPELDGPVLRRLAWQLERGDTDLIVASSLVDVAGARTTVRPMDGLPLLEVAHPRLAGGSRIAKAVFDRVGAAVLLVLGAPLLSTIALAVRWGSPGPVLFRQIRVGKGGREFLIYKFRTMFPDAEAQRAALRPRSDNDGVLFKMRDDPRVTPIGRFLRRYSLDELPQLVNVLAGHMSLVGPRPPLPEEVAAYPADMHRRLAVRPGLTGLWQVSGRADLAWEEAVKLDLGYVENWSLSLDLLILLRTLTAVCRASGAY